MLADLASRLRDLRLDAHLSGRDLARRAGWHASKISKIEHGTQTPSVADIHTWCEHTGAAGTVDELVASMRQAEGLFVEWQRLQQPGLHAVQVATLPDWEGTRTFRFYSSTVIPTPLQTRAYMTALMRALVVRKGLPDDVEAAATAREVRQRQAGLPGRRFAVLLEESVLHHNRGGAETMAAQLGHLLTASARPDVSLGVVPLGADRSVTGPTETFFMFDDHLVKIELVSGWLRVTQRREIALYEQMFRELSALAVRGPAARALITAAISALDADRPPRRPTGRPPNGP